LNLQLRAMSNELNDEQLKQIAERTHGFSGSDLENLCRKGNSKSNNRISSILVFSKSLRKKKQLENLCRKGNSKSNNRISSILVFSKSLRKKKQTNEFNLRTFRKCFDSNSTK